MVRVMLLLLLLLLLVDMMLDRLWQCYCRLVENDLQHVVPSLLLFMLVLLLLLLLLL